MLTARQNLEEVIKGGNPDRFSNQYEGLKLLFHPFMMFSSPLLQKGQPDVVNAWGITNSFPDNVPGAFPVHTPDKILIKDIEHWQDYVKRAPASGFPDEMWGATMGMASMADRENQFIAPFIAPGLFEQCHHFCEIQNAMIYLYEYPDEMHDLIKFLTD